MMNVGLHDRSKKIYSRKNEFLKIFFKTKGVKKKAAYTFVRLVILHNYQLELFWRMNPIVS